MREIYRLVYGPSEQVEVQEWSAPYWCPSLAPLHVALAASLAPRDVLQTLGVPAADWPGDQVLPWDTPELVRILPTPPSSADGHTSTGETL